MTTNEEFLQKERVMKSNIATAALLAFVLGAMSAAPAMAQANVGIKVHGHWAIDVRNADGTPVSHTEFENALTSGQSGGPGILARVLGHQTYVALWQVALLAPNGGLAYAIGEPGQTNGNNSTDLQVTVNQDPASPGLILTGSVAALGALSIGQVASATYGCPQSVDHDACLSQFAGYLPFTFATLSSPVVVQPGQIILVTVTLTFS